MSTVHVLDRSATGYRCFIHFTVPTGSNSAGVTWKAAGLAAGVLGSTKMVEGVGAGQISTAEKALVVTGDTVEFEAIIEAETGGTSGAQLGATVDAIAVTKIAEYQAVLQAKLKWYGAVRA